MKRKIPRVTVLMPVYNGEAFLHKAIDSILKQTFSDFEFLIIDDGSCDRSREIVRSYHDSRIHLVENGNNLGLEKSLNRGIHLAKGEYIVRMDADDISLPRRIQTQVAFMDAAPRVAACGSWVKTLGEPQVLWKYPLTHDEICCWLLFCSALAHPSAIIRKAVFNEDHILYNVQGDYKRAEDYDLWTRISRKRELANIGEVLLRYRLHENNAGAKHRSKTIISADRIRKDQLNKLTTDFSEEEFALHSRISRCKFESTEEFVLTSVKWLIKLMEKNMDTSCYPTVTFNRLLSDRWWRICSNATGLGLKTWSVFWASPLSKHTVLSQKQKTRFFLKCFFKIKHF